MIKDLTEDELNEMIGDGTCTHLPFVRAALEIRRRRYADLTAEDISRIRATRDEMARFYFLDQIPELIQTLDRVLAREMLGWAGRDHRDSAAWPWDPSRLLAGQYEATLLTDVEAATAPRATAWEIDGPVRGTADAAPRIAVPVATGPEPEHGVEVVPVDCPREECATECTAVYGACVVETEEP